MPRKARPVRAMLLVAVLLAANVRDSQAQASVANGNAWMAQGRYQEALANFDAVLQANPNAADAWVGRGQALNMRGDIAGAITSYNTALQRGAAAMPGLRAWIGELYLAAGDQRNAEAAFADELRVAPQSAWAYSWLGTLRILQGRDGEAAQAFANAQWLDPQVLSHRYNNGVGMFNAGQGGRAWMDFRTVVAMNPDAAGAYYAMATIYRQAGMIGPAVQSLQAYLQRDTSSEWAQRARQELASLQPQAPATGVQPQAWMGQGGINPPVATPGDGPISVSPGPGPSPATLPSTGSGGGTPTGYSGNVCPADTRNQIPAELQKVMAASSVSTVPCQTAGPR